MANKSGGPAASPTPESDAREIIKLLGEFASAEQLKNLVKAYRSNVKDYAISATSEELLKSVQKLFGAYQIPALAIESLLERAEENGRQHIFLYRASSSAQRCLNDFELVQRVLLDGKTRKQAGLPKFQIHPRGIENADLRTESRESSKYHFWVYKLYGGSERWVQKSSKISENGDEKIVRYRLDYRRDVFLVKWHSFGLLEIRIATGNSRAQLSEARDELLKAVGKIVSSRRRDDTIQSNLFESLIEVISARRSSKLPNEDDIGADLGFAPLAMPVSLLDADARNPEVSWIQVNDSLLDFHGVKLRVSADAESEDAYGKVEVRELLKPAKDCEQLRSTIHVSDYPRHSQRIAVEFATNFPNELRIGAQTSPEAIEFIVRRIWEKAEGATLPPSPADELGRIPEEVRTPVIGNLESISQRFPYLVNAYKGVAQWLSENPTVDYVDSERLRREATAGVPLEDFAAALATLVEEGTLDRKYRVRPRPGRQFIAQTFDSLDEILNGDIKDSGGEPINLDEAKVVSVFGRGDR